MNTVNWQAIAATPWWVFLYVGFIIWLAYSVSKPRIISLKQLYLLSLFFCALTALAVCPMYKSLALTDSLIWLDAMILGTGLGYLQLQFQQAKAIPNTESIYHPGTWLFFVLILAGLGAKFYFDLDINFTPQDFINPKNLFYILFAYGLFTGIYTGKLGYALRSTKQGPFTA